MSCGFVFDIIRVCNPTAFMGVAGKILEMLCVSNENTGHGMLQWY